jgi:WD40 repeat protein
MAFSPDSRTLVTSSDDGTVKLWNLIIGKEALSLRGHKGWVTSARFSPDGTILATAGADGIIRLWIRATEEDVIAFDAAH